MWHWKLRNLKKLFWIWERSLFWVIEFVYQIKFAYSSLERTNEKYSNLRVWLSWKSLQVRLINPSLADDFLIILLVCSLKLSFESNVTPRSLISFTSEILIF